MLAMMAVIAAGGGTSLIGTPGEAGGIIVFDKGVFSDGWQFIEMAPENWNGGTDPQTTWGCQGDLLLGGFGSWTTHNIGIGKELTDAIVAGCSQSGIAAKLARSCSFGNKFDWYLPDRQTFIHVTGVITDLKTGSSDNYWTSSEESSFSAMTWGANSWLQKFEQAYVRPVRRY